MKRKNATRSALFTSIISLLLCVSMLVGTTFAWFTDEVTSGRNTIAAGNLDVELYANDIKVDGSTMLFDDVDPNLWEPGAVAYENLQVKNVGTLALQYTMNLTVQDETVVDGNKLSDVIKVGIVEGGITSTNRNEVIGQVQTWTKLSDFSLNMSGKKLEAKTDDTVFGIVLYWQPNANEIDNLYNMNNGRTEVLKLEIGVKLTATQVVHENDSFGPDYDKDADKITFLSGATKVYDSTKEGGNYALTADIKTSDSEKHYNGNREYAIRDGMEYTLNLNGHTLSHDGVYQDGKNTGYTYLFTTAYEGKLTINGEGTINSANSEGNAVIVYAQGPSEVVINGGDFNVHKGIAVWAGKNGKVTINGGRFISTGSAGNEELIYSSGGVIDIFGGFFHNKEWEERPVNVADANRNTGRINIYGGTFVNFDPSTGGNDPGQIKVAEGYKVVSETQANGDVWYTVVKNTAATAEELVAALAAGGKITLANDIEFTEMITIPSGTSVTLDMNGKTISVPDGSTAADPLIALEENSSLVIDGNGTFNLNGNTGANLLWPKKNSNATITIKSGNFLRDAGNTKSNYGFPFVVGESSCKLIIEGGYFDGGYYAEGDCDGICKSNLNLSTNQYVRVYGGTFVGQNPAWGDEGKAALCPHCNINGSGCQGVFLEGQTTTSTELPEGYTIVEGTTEDGRPTYTVNYSK